MTTLESIQHIEAERTALYRAIQAGRWCSPATRERLRAIPHVLSKLWEQRRAEMVRTSVPHELIVKEVAL